MSKNNYSTFFIMRHFSLLWPVFLIMAWIEKLYWHVIASKELIVKVFIIIIIFIIKNTLKLYLHWFVNPLCMVHFVFYFLCLCMKDPILNFYHNYFYTEICYENVLQLYMPRLHFKNYNLKIFFGLLKF